MTPQDKMKAILPVALIAAFATLAALGKMPLELALLGMGAAITPSPLQAIIAALRDKSPPPPATPAAPPPPPSFDTPLDRGGKGPTS